MMQLLSLLLRYDGVEEVWRRLLHRLHANTVAVGMRRSIGSAEALPRASMAVRLRPARPADVEHLVQLRENSRDRHERHHLLLRILLFKMNLPTCYIAESPDGSPCYIQWLVRSCDQELLDKIFPGWFPRLKPDEVLLEYAYTFPSARRRGVMAHSIANICAIASENGARWAVVFIPQTNSVSLRAHAEIGFSPYLLRTSKRRPFSRDIRFTNLDSSEEKSRASATAHDAERT